jgi:hypothetical protein
MAEVTVTGHLDGSPGTVTYPTSLFSSFPDLPPGFFSGLGGFGAVASAWNGGLRYFRNNAVITAGGEIIGAVAIGAVLRGLASSGVATIDTALVRFTQSSVKQTLTSGENINDLAAALRGPGGDALAESFEPIRIFEQNGSLFTLDNRRLLAFSMAGRDIPYVWATAEDVLDQSWKFTATPGQAGGWFIRVK